MNKRYQIGELAKELNLNKETIRYYEKIGILNSPKRESNGYRYYSEDDREESDGCDLRHLKQFISEKINSVNHKIEELGRVKIFLEELNKNLLSE
ncbi:MAG: transcriptional regulator, MerR family [Anaerocolumna sp.]|nr:transcriptional regulator, MerR family [Anaerocolumna sp.]